MKKLFLTSVLSFSAVFMATNKEILNPYDHATMQAHGLSIKVADRKALNDGSGFEMVTLKISQGDMS